MIKPTPLALIPCFKEISSLYVGLPCRYTYWNEIYLYVYLGTLSFFFLCAFNSVLVPFQLCSGSFSNITL